MLLHLWENTLSAYGVEQVTGAAYRIVRFKKGMAFLTISHLMSELFDKDKDGDVAKRLAKLKEKIAQPYVETDPIRK